MTISPLNLRRKRVKARTRPRDVTLADFSGGIKVTDNELALVNRFSIIEDNVFANEDRSKTVRFGTKLFTTTPANIIDTIYFADHIVSVLADGRLTKTTNAGVTTVIWDTTIAAELPDSPSAWGATTRCDFTENKQDLIVVNGSDKPLIIDQSLSVDYLQDLATGSNVNTPIAKFVTTVGSFTVKAGVTSQPSTVIYISSQGTSGVWPGDAAPNNAISFDVGAYTGQGGSEVIGLATFRNYLIVNFENFMAILQLGEFDADGNHTPQVIDTREQSGALNHRTALALSDDLIILDRNFVYSAQRNLFGGAFEAESISSNVNPLLQRALAAVPENDTGSFVVHDKLGQRIMFFVRQSSTIVTIFVFSHNDRLSRFSVSTISGWNFQGGCSSRLKRTFLFKDDEIYQYGNSIFDNEDFSADFITTENPEGVAIDFNWELPWMDANQRAKTKQAEYMLFDTSGTGEFFLDVFVNKNLKDTNGNYIPVRSQNYRCGDLLGYGRNAPVFGSGRPANEERLYTMNVRFRTIKLRFRGSTRERITFNSFSLLYLLGTYVA